MNILERTVKAILPNLFKRDLDSRYPKGFNLLFGGGTTSAGKQVSQRSSIGLSAIYHAVDLISQDYASLPHKVFSYTTSGKDVLTDSNEHRLLNLEPNYYQTPFEFHRMMAVYRLMYGNAYAAIERGESGQIINLIPIHPENVIDIIDYQQELFYEIREVPDLIPARNMIHVRDLQVERDKKCPFKGTSRIDLCRESIGQGLAMQEYASQLFGNGVNPGMILESDAGVLEDEEQRRAIQNSLKDYQGSENSHRPLVLPWGVKVSSGPTKFNQQQTQFIETKIHFVEEVAQMFNLPLHKMRIDNNGNSYNSVEQHNLDYISDCLKPFAIAFEQEYNRKLFVQRGEAFVQASTKEKLMSDLKSVADYVDKMVKNGVFSVNKALEMLGENRIGPEGDIRYIQSNMMPLGENPIKNGNENT